MKLRRYESSDCKEITEIFYETVHSVNKKDYSDTQLNAWATGKVDLEVWDQSFLEHYTVVKEQQVMRGEEILVNYVMVKTIDVI